jgi:anti-sigma regulatory factor (Ser/Thr protein kinase)
MEIVDRQMPLREPSAIGEARRCAAELARQAGLDDTLAGRVALIVTEAATNAVKHGGGGECLLHAGPGNVEIVVLDSGAGILNLSHALRDGFSSGGTPGTGLGAIARLSSAYDVYSRPAKGTVVYAAVRNRTSANGFPLIGAVTVPYPGETVCGDAWTFDHADGRSVLLVADGLGHGGAAYDAARAAVGAFAARHEGSPVTWLEDIHLGLRATRGAAVALAEIDRRRGVIRFAGVGNIAATVISDGKTRSLVSLHGTAGHDVRRFQEFTSPWNQPDLLVLHSDGLSARWGLDAYPGLSQRHPMLLAAVLYRDYRRGRDDATVVAVRDVS